MGSTQIFVALHRSMLQLKRFAVAFYGNAASPHLVALIAQEEITTSNGQVEPPGMHMIKLPYADDIREIEEAMDYVDKSSSTPYASEDQIKKAVAVMKRVDLKDFSVCQFSNPVLQRHYSALQALALEEDEMPDVKDETLPDEKGMSRPGVVNALEEFKLSVFEDSYETEDNNEPSRKRKAEPDDAVKDSAKYDWHELADSGKLKDLTVAELKSYLVANNLPVSGKKEVLISRISTHMRK
ncbi:hypothetical protein Droror1_Dr00025991 [Drosera rotundifolia]